MKKQTVNMVDVFLPRATGREENFVFVGLNGKGYQILRGQTVRVPEPVYRILMDAELARGRQERFMEAQARRGREAGV